MNKLVSIILLNYNNNSLTIDCLKSLKNQIYKNFEVILVDNGSKYEIFLELRKELTQFKNELKIFLIRSKINLFFTGGNNKAIKLAKGDYICLLNNDTTLSPNFIKAMVDFFELNTNTGMISPKIKVYSNKKYIWYAGAELNFRTANIVNIRGYWECDEYDQKYLKITTTAYSAGTALFLKRDLIKKIGLLDDIFFMYFEETDWNLRAKKEGYKNYYVPTSIVYHKVSRSSNNKQFSLKHFFINRNSQILVWKYAGFIDILIFYIKFIIGNFRVYLKAITKKKIYNVILQLHSLWQGFRIGVKRRTNRSCRKLLIKTYKTIKRIERKYLT